MRFSRRQFIASAGCVVGGPFAHVGIAEGAAAAAPAGLTLTAANYVRFMPIASGDIQPKDLASISSASPTASALVRQVPTGVDGPGRPFQARTESVADPARRGRHSAVLRPWPDPRTATMVAIIGGEPRRFRPLIDLPSSGRRRAAFLRRQVWPRRIIGSSLRNRVRYVIRIGWNPKGLPQNSRYGDGRGERSCRPHVPDTA